MFARRQQQQQQQQLQSQFSSPLTTFQHHIPQQRTKRKSSDSSIGLPDHFDFSFRDRSDATAKRRFQVKVPTKILVSLSLVFIIIPGIIFLHKEFHIHENHHDSHYKTEKYINVKTDEVFMSFRLATANTSAPNFLIHDEVDASNFTSSALNKTVISNHTIHDDMGMNQGIEKNKITDEYLKEGFPKIDDFERERQNQDDLIYRQENINSQDAMKISDGSKMNTTEHEN